MADHLPALDELARAVEYFEQHDGAGAGNMAFINGPTITATLAFLRELQMRRISMHQQAVERDSQSRPVSSNLRSLLIDARQFVGKSRCSVGHSVSEVLDRAKPGDRHCLYCEHQAALHDRLMTAVSEATVAAHETTARLHEGTLGPNGANCDNGDCWCFEKPGLETSGKRVTSPWQCEKCSTLHEFVGPTAFTLLGYRCWKCGHDNYIARRPADETTARTDHAENLAKAVEAYMAATVKFDAEGAIEQGQWDAVTDTWRAVKTAAHEYRKHSPVKATAHQENGNG